MRAFVDTREQSVWSDCTCSRVSVDTDTTFKSYKRQVCPLTILVCRLKVTCLLSTDDTAKTSINMITLCTCNNLCRFVKHNQSVNVIPHSNQGKSTCGPQSRHRIVAVESAHLLTYTFLQNPPSCTLQLYIAGACHEFSDSQADQCC